MDKRQPIVAWLFDLAGIVMWVGSILTVMVVMRIPTTIATADGTGAIANFQGLSVQTQMVIAAVGQAIVGTLFLGFSALVKRLPR